RGQRYLSSFHGGSYRSHRWLSSFVYTAEHNRGFDTPPVRTTLTPSGVVILEGLTQSRSVAALFVVGDLRICGCGTVALVLTGHFVDRCGALLCVAQAADHVIPRGFGYLGGV